MLVHNAIQYDFKTMKRECGAEGTALLYKIKVYTVYIPLDIQLRI